MLTSISITISDTNLYYYYYYMEDIIIIIIISSTFGGRSNCSSLARNGIKLWFCLFVFRLCKQYLLLLIRHSEFTLLWIDIVYPDHFSIQIWIVRQTNKQKVNEYIYIYIY